MGKILEILIALFSFLRNEFLVAHTENFSKRIKLTLAKEHTLEHLPTDSQKPTTTNQQRTTIYLFVLCTLYTLLSSAQNFPVQVIPQALPPAPIYISNYADASMVSSPLRVQIILNDFEIANREIRLKTYVVGSGLNFESNDLVVGASPLFLEGGVPLVLTNVDLAPYFQYENISGISPNVYGQPIPEGAYQFCFEVYDVLTGNRLSNRSCAVSVVFQNEPPFLVSPRNNTNVDEVNPQYIVFQWTPRSINVSNVEYELSLVEIWDNQVDPQQAFLSSPPIFQVTTTSPTYVYGPSDPLLLSGKNYAWRVQAKARQGTEEIGLFKNEGFSEIFSFSYASACELPIGISHEVKGSTNANIFWDDFSTEIPEYTVRYRQKNVSDAEWFLEKTSSNQLTIWQLKAGTVYEYQLSKSCGITQSDWSITKEFTTALEFDEESVLDCGVSPDINLTNMEPLASIGVGAKFKAGDFPIEILEVSGSSGRFTGKGYVKLPYLENIKVAVEFTNILINTDSEMAEGTVITVYDPTWKNVLDVDVLIDVADDILDEFSGGDFTEYSVDFAIPGKENITIDQDNGVIVITGANGETTTKDYDEGDTYQITDSNNNTYNIDKEGNVTKGAEGAEGGEATAQNTDGVSGGNGTASSPSVTNITATGISVSFEESSTTKYYLDKADGAYELANYPKALMPNGDSYYPIHKAVVESQTDTFIANITISNPNITINDLIVKTISGQKIEAVPEGNTLKITVTGETSYKNQEAIITYKAEDGKYKIAASFFVHHIKQHDPINVVVVQVSNEGTNSTAINNLTTDLNTIYGKAGASFNVSTNTMALLNSDWDDNDNDQLDYNASGLTSNYPDELKNIQQAYKSQNSNWDRTAYHLFVLPSTMPITKPLAGFMPKTRQWGYIFDAQTGGEELIEDKESSNLIAAHELGHGAFRLDHPFSNDDNAAGSDTDWLMDYNSGNQLSYIDWARMSDEGLNIGLFQNQEDGELAGKTWFDPEWNPISIPSSTTIIASDLGSAYQGALPGFKTKDEIEYKAKFDTSGKFLGYLNNGTAANSTIVVSQSPDENSDVFMFQYGGCGNNFRYKYKYKNTLSTFSAYRSNQPNAEKHRYSDACTNREPEGNPFDVSICDLIDPENSVEDYAVTAAKDQLNLAYESRSNVSSSIRNKSNFYHLINYDQNSFGGRGGSLEDKLFLLKEETGINFYVVFQPVTKKMTNDARDDFARQVLESSQLPPSEKNIVITIPYTSFQTDVIYRINCVQPGFAQNDPSLVSSPYFGFKEKTNLFEYILGAFTGIEKPMFLRRYFLTAEGALVNYETQSIDNQNVRGYAFINAVQFFESPYLADIKDKQEDIARTDPSQNPELDLPIFIEIRNGWISDLNTLFTEAKEQETKAFIDNNITFWGDSKEIKDLGSLREFYIKDIDISNTYVTANIESPYIEGWKIFFDNSILLPEYLNNYNEWSVIDETIYNTLDGISLIPGADIFTDPVGFAYAGLRGDVLNTTIYGTSAAIPFLGSVYLKGVKNGLEYTDEAYAVIAKKVNGDIQLNVENVSNLNANEFQVSPIFTSDKDIADQITNQQINDSSLDLENISKLFDEPLLNEVDDLINQTVDVIRGLDKVSESNRLDVLFNTLKNNSNITDGAQLALLEKIKDLGGDAHKFIDDFAENAIALEKFAENSGLIDSWKLLDDLPDSFVKTDVTRLEIFHSLTDTNKNLIKQFTDINSNSTLSKFLDDCDDDFLQFINNSDNSLEVKGFLAHKDGMLTEDEANTIFEMLEGSDEIPNEKVREWLEYGYQQAVFKVNREAGNAFGNLIKTQLKDSSSDAYRALKDKLSSSNLNLDDYSIYSQVQLCLKGDCISKGNYWIPDFMLVVERTDAISGVKYLETIIVDAKLSRGTGWTKNQGVANGMSDWNVKTISPDGLLKGTPIDGFIKDASVTKNGNFIKLFNEGGVLKTN